MDRLPHPVLPGLWLPPSLPPSVFSLRNHPGYRAVSQGQQRARGRQSKSRVESGRASVEVGERGIRAAEGGGGLSTGGPGGAHAG